MEKVVVSAKTGQQKLTRLSEAEQAQRKAEDATFVPKADEPTIEDILMELGVVSAEQIDAVRHKLRQRARSGK